MRRLSIAAMLLIVLTALAACGGGAKETPVTAPAQPAAATQAPAAAAKATEAPAPTAAAQPAATKAPEPAPTPTAEEALPVPKPSALKSYFARIEIKSEVTEPEPGLEAWSVLEMTYRLDPAPVAYRMRITDKTGQERPDVEMIVIGKDMYIKDPDGGDTWTKLPTAAGFGDVMQMMVDPEALTKDAPTDIFSAANVVSRNETVDGVATTHYRAPEAQMRALIAKSQAETGQEQKIISASADFWVAKKGNYLKQYRSEAVYEDADGRQVKTVMQMLVTDENKPVTIEPPPADKVTDMGGMLPEETPEPEATPEPASPETTAALAALPAPPQSKEYKLAELPEGTRFVVEMMAAGLPARVFLSDATVEEINAFYKTEMPKRGYQAGMQMPGEMGMAFSMYQKGDQIVMIRVGEDNESGKRVVILQIP